MYAIVSIPFRQDIKAKLTNPSLTVLGVGDKAHVEAWIKRFELEYPRRILKAIAIKEIDEAIEAYNILWNTLK